MKLKQWSLASQVGTLYLVAGEEGLCGVYLEQQKIPMAKSLNSDDATLGILKSATDQLKEYFAGKRRQFDLPLNAIGTEFQKQVWQQLGKIPYGKTCSYKDVARDIDRNKATRAVGSANGKNPLCIVVPCHRVIAADGSLGGYSGGLDIKRKLLALEGSLAQIKD